MISSFFWTWIFPIEIDTIKFILIKERLNRSYKSRSVIWTWNGSWKEWWWESPTSNRSNNFQFWILWFVSNNCCNICGICWINCSNGERLFSVTIIFVPIRLWLIWWWTEEWKTIIKMGNWTNNWCKIRRIIFIWWFSISSPISVIHSNNWVSYWFITRTLACSETIIASWSIFGASVIWCWTSIICWFYTTCFTSS